VDLGKAGEAWLAGLDGLVRELAIEWHLSTDQTLPGGTESIVAKASTAEGQDAVCFKFIDPDGLFIERACNRGISCGSGRGTLGR
jgi:hypothetical protein